MSPAKHLRLEDFGVDLTVEARAERLDPVVGRTAEIGRVVRILCRKTKNNPVLLGAPGVGKSAVVEGLAQRIVAGEVPPALADVTLFSLNLGSLLAGTSFRGDFEERLQALVAELRRPGVKRLLFIDELHLLGKAGRSDGGLDAGNLLKPLLARGELPCIGASTAPEWQELVARDPALERRFQPVDVPEPSPADAVAILRGLRPRYERHHGVEIGDDALDAAVAESVSRAPERRLPDKAIDLLDEACALVRLATAAPAGAEYESVLREIAAAEARFDLHAVARLRYRILPRLAQPPKPRVTATDITTLAGHVAIAR